jgi:hypothetical protein
MKIKLTPQLSYIIGLWKETRTKEGIGVQGNEEHLSLFAKEVLESGLTEPQKLLTSRDEPKEGEEEQETSQERGSVYFYHTSYRKFFQKVVDDELERFKYKNEYSANFLAGLFDAVGTITDDGRVYLSRCTQKDEMVLYRIGFNPARKGRFTYFTRPLKFLAYIKPFTKMYRDHPVFSKI